MLEIGCADPNPDARPTVGTEVGELGGVYLELGGTNLRALADSDGREPLVIPRPAMLLRARMLAIDSATAEFPSLVCAELLQIRVVADPRVAVQHQ